MKKPRFILVVCFFAAVSGLFGIGEKTISIGGASGWDFAEVKEHLSEVERVRPRAVLLLSSQAASVTAGAGSGGLDMSLSFDEGSAALFKDSTGRYRVTAAPSLEAVDRRYAHSGSGAALFPGVFQNAVLQTAGESPVNRQGSTVPAGPLVIEPQSRDALFAPGSRFRDFSVEFWLYPLNMENGEQMLSWISSQPALAVQAALAAQNADRRSGGSVFQRIQCTASKNRLQWSFLDFFASPDGTSRLNITLSGDSAVVPKIWSHHLIRFDSATGMIEYLVNGGSEAIAYATASGREGGEVYTPEAGQGGGFVLGGRFMGLIDEFKISGEYSEKPSTKKFPRQGRMETRAIDLGAGSAGRGSVLKVEAFGGRIKPGGGAGSSEFRQNGRFLFAGDSEMQFFIRASENPYRWDETRWQTFVPGEALDAQGGSVLGRYVQVAVDFYPSADGETSPYLDELRITYMPDDPPLPPSSLTAVALDGGVELRWKISPDSDTAGYLVYYGTAGGEYFGEGAVLGASPIDAGKRNAVFIDGLKNGTLYYFRVAAYDRRDGFSPADFHAGEFSREVRARPLEGLSSRIARIANEPR